MNDSDGAARLTLNSFRNKVGLLVSDNPSRSGRMMSWEIKNLHGAGTYSIPVTFLDAVLDEDALGDRLVLRERGLELYLSRGCESLISHAVPEMSPQHNITYFSGGSEDGLKYHLSEIRMGNRFRC